jgi:type IV pilus assembly protein PilF
MQKINYTLKYTGLLLLFMTLLGCNTSRTRMNTPLPTAASYNVQLGVLYLEQGEMASAKQKLLLAMQQAPHWSPALDALAYFWELTGEPKRAEEFYKKAVQLDPGSGAALNNYAVFLCRSKRYEVAEKYFILATADVNYVNVVKAYENAGLCAVKINNDKKAEQFFNKALQNDPHSATVLLEMAELKYRQAFYRESENYLQRYLMIGPANAQTRILGQLLKNKRSI